MRSVVRFGAHVGRGVRRLALDGALGRRRPFPRLIADLTPTELSAIIGRRVDSVAVLDGATGTSSRARLGLTGYDVPASVFVKMSADSAGIRMLGSWRRSVRPRLGSIANWHRNSVREFHVRTARRSTV